VTISQQREVAIIAAVRTPTGNHKGLMRYIPPDELLAITLMDLVKRAGIDPAMIDDVISGCANQTGEQSSNIARTSALMAGFPIEVPGTTVQRQCGSAETALHFGCQAILSGDMSIVIAAGVESMSRVPLGSGRGDTPWHPWLTEKYEITNQGIAAERIATRWNISRRELDEFSLESHKRAIAAKDAFTKEIVPIKVKLPDGTEQLIEHDDGPRGDTNINKLSNLRPVFDPQGVITAGNSSQMTNGAAALLLMDMEKAKELGLKPRAKVISRVVVGDDPTYMLTGPIQATKRILEKTGMSIQDMDAVEINEAFASVVLAWENEIKPDMDKVNQRGGAIALGHPTGCSGVRLTVTLLNILEQSGGEFGLQTICHGGGTATASIIQVLK
jgi:acetyl-CoA acyltransferase